MGAKSDMRILKNIISFSTVITAIVYGLISFFQGTTDLYQNLILSLLVLISTTFLISDIEYNNKFTKYFEQIDGFIEKSSIQTFESVDLCAKEINHLVSNGTHTVDFVSIDTSIRTNNNKKSNAMHKAVQSLFTNKDVRLLYVTYLRKKTIDKFIRNIDLGNLHINNNTYGYIELNNMIPFATFLIIDNQIVITRSPYEAGQEASYIIVRNEILAKHYKDWMNMIWKEIKKVETLDDINSIYKKFKTKITDQQKKDIEKHIKNIKNKIG